MKARRKICIAIGLMITGIFTYIAIVFAIESQHILIKVAAAEKAVPIQLAIDPTQTGRYEGVIEQTYCSEHFWELSIIADPPFTESEAKTLEALEFNLEATPLLNCAYTHPALDMRNGQRLLLANLEKNAAPGKYQIVLNITKPLPAVQGRRYMLVAPYFLCGLERLSGSVILTLGAIFGFIACVSAIISLLAWRKGRSLDQTKQLSTPFYNG